MTSKWSSGPVLLWQNEDKWPVGLKEDLPHPSQVMLSDPEVKGVTVLARENMTKQSIIADLLEYFSNWFRARLAMAVCLLYFQKLQEQVSAERKCSNTKTMIQVDDIREAEAVIIKSVQSVAFPDELKSPKLTQDVEPVEVRSSAPKRVTHEKNSSALLKLDLFIDLKGILRIGGRLRNASLPFGIKFPVILPRQSCDYP